MFFLSYNFSKEDTVDHYVEPVATASVSQSSEDSTPGISTEESFEIDRVRLNVHCLKGKTSPS